MKIKTSDAYATNGDSQNFFNMESLNPHVLPFF